ncbi:hypothetical protein ACI79C_22990 [Geodermatophilus sp. SYSU D00697]
MTTLAPPSERFAVLDGLIVRALGDLRAARRACARSNSREDLARRDRAEAELNALLEYRHAAQHR